MVKNHQGKKVNREEEDFIKSLKRRNEELQKENNGLQAKLKNASLTLQKYKQQIQSLKIRYGGGQGPIAKKKYSGDSDDGCKLSVASCDLQVLHHYDDDMNMVLTKLQERLLQSESSIDSLRSENELLKSMKSRMELQIKQNVENYEERNEEVSILKKQLHEAARNLKSMTIQYDTLEANASVQLEIQKETRSKLEACNSYIVKLQQELHMLQMEKDIAEKTARKVEEHKEQVQDLIEENKRLEDNLSKLCELPFVKDKGDSTEPLINEHIIEEIEAKNIEYREQMLKLKTSHEGAIASMQKEIENYKMKYTSLLSEIETRTTTSKQSETQQPTMQVRDEACQTTAILFVEHCDTSIQAKYNDDIYSQNTCVNEYKDSTTITSGSNAPNVDDNTTLINRDSMNESKWAQAIQSHSTPVLASLVEISVNDAQLDRGLISACETTMLTSNFLDYRAMESCQCVGWKPKYNFFMKYNISSEKYTRNQLDQAQFSFEIIRIDSQNSFEPIAYAVLSLHDVMQEEGKKVSHRVQLFVKDSNLVVGYLQVIVCYVNVTLTKPNKTELIHRQGKEEKDDYSDSMVDRGKKTLDKEEKDDDSESNYQVKGKDLTFYDSKSVNESSIQNELRYFDSNGDVNYIDFLRFVDPPYPILNQIKNLERVNTELERALIHHNNSTTAENEDNDFISEEDFVQVIKIVGTKGIQLYEVQAMFRHINSNGEKKLSLNRICHFLFSRGINNLRQKFLSFRSSSINPWDSFKVADPHRTGFVSKIIFEECLRSIGIDIS